MAYREIDDRETAIDAPITSELMTAMRDNLEAIRIGDATSPKSNINSKVSVIHLNALKRGTPTAGRYVVWTETGHDQEDNSSIVSVRFRTTGEYRVQVSARTGSTRGSGDNNPPNSFFSAIVKVQSSGTTTTLQTVTFGSQLVSAGGTDSTHNTQKFEFDRTFQATDFLFVEYDEISFSQGSVTLSIGVSDPETMYGVDVRGNIT